MAEIASAYVSLIPSFKGGGAKIGQQLSGPVDQAGKSSGKRFGSAMSGGISSMGSKIFAPLAVAAGAIGVGNFLKGAIGEARESQKVGAITANVIKTTGGAAKVTAGQVGALSTAISNKTGIDDEAVQSASNLLLTFTNVRNEVGKNNDVFNQATQAATDMGAALGKDPKSAAIQLGKALNDPVKGITALSRVGVSFTAGQKDQIKTMTKSGNTLGAQKLILGELKKEFGGTAAASATAGEKFATTFSNFKEAIGTAILPVLDKVLGGLTGFVGFLTAKVGPVVKQLGPIFKPVTDAVEVFMAALGNQDVTTQGTLGKIGAVAYGIRDAFMSAIPVVKQFITQGLGTLKTVGGVLLSVLGPVFAKIPALFGAIMPVLMGASQGIMSALGPVLKSLPGLFAQLLPVVSAVGKIILMAFSVVSKQVGPMIGTLAKTILSVFKGIATNVGPIIATVAGVVVDLFKLIAPAVQQLVPVIGSFLVSLSGLAATLVAAFAVVWPPIKSLIASIITQLVPGLKAIFAVVQTQVVPALKSFALAIAPIIAWLVNKLAPIVTTVFGVVMSVIKNAMKIIAGVIKLVTSVIKGDWSGAWDAIKGILSAAWAIIKTVVTGAIKVVKSVISTGLSILGAIWGRAWDGIKAAAGAIWEKIKSVATAAMGKLVTGVKTKIGEAVTFVKGIPGKITAALTGLGSLLLHTGEHLIEGLIQGIGNKASELKDFIVGFIKDHVPGPILHFLGINSPSKLFADMGKQIPAGLINGIGSQRRKVDDTMRKLVDPAKLKMKMSAGSVALPGAGDATRAGKAVRPVHVTYTGAVTVTDHKEFARKENARLRDVITMANLRVGAV